MDRQAEILRDLFYDKILLYRELVENLKEERGYLVKTDMDALWKISAKKQELVSAIETVRQKILSALSTMAIEHGMDVSSFSLSKVVREVSQDHRGMLRKPYLTLVSLKAQTRQLSAENKAFIEESLDFLDEVMGIISGCGVRDGVYDGGGTVQTKKSGSHRLFCREV
jgi:flagellar biosynthesis/type III secretory pathway chaperone